MQIVNMELDVSTATTDNQKRVTVDDDNVSIFIADGFDGGTLDITCTLDSVEYPQKVSFPLADGPSGPFLLVLSQYGFSPNLVLRVHAGTAQNPPSKVNAHRMERGRINGKW